MLLGRQNLGGCGRFHWLAGLVWCLVVLSLGSPAPAQDLRLRGSDYIGDLPTHIIGKQRLLDEFGIELSFGTSGAGNLRDLRAGRTDFALMALTPIVIDALSDPDPGRPDDPVILAGISYAQPPISVISTRSPAGTAPTSLHGQRLAVQMGTNAHFIWSLFVRAHGLDPGRIDLVDMPTTEIPGAISDGRIDGGILWEPYASQVLKAFSGSATAYSTDGLHVSRWLLVGRREVIDAHRNRTAAILRAYLAAVKWLQGHPRGMDDLVADLFPTGAGSDAYQRVVYQVSLDWSLFRSYREQLAWAAAAFGAEHDRPLPEFADIIAAYPLAAVRPSTMRLPDEFGRQRQERP